MGSSNVSFGVDLSGFSRGKTGIARAEKASGNNRIEVFIIGDNKFNVIRSRSEKLHEATEGEINEIREFLRHGPVYYDAPIDLQNLPDPVNPQFIWELTMRPVDVVFNAIPPLADKIGACASRIRNIIRHLCPDPDSDFVGEKIFETYPAASLKLMRINTKTYKGGNGAVFNKGGWQGKSADNKDATLAGMLNTLGWKASPDLLINDDEFDAAICAVTGLMPGTNLLRGKNLDALINQTLHDKGFGTKIYSAPKGYTLMKELSSQIYIHRE